jgi:hypothetical protein
MSFESSMALELSVFKFSLMGNALMERRAVTIDLFLYQVACCGLQMYLIFVQ